MKVKVIQAFYDRETGEKRDVEGVYEYETARAKELIKRGFCEMVQETEETEKVAEIDDFTPITTAKKTRKSKQ